MPTEEELRQEREYNRRAVSFWKSSAQAIRDGTGMLMRESRAVAIANIEDAARTNDDYKLVNAIWDERERIEQWRIDKHENQSANPLMENEQPQTVIPQPLGHIYWRQLLAGNFLDAIYDCPHEIHEMTASRPVYDLTKGLDDNRKEILYYWAIRLWSPQKIAAFRGQTDRNIRKVYNKMIEEIRLKLFDRLLPRYKAGEVITQRQKEFVQICLANNRCNKVKDDKI